MHLAKDERYTLSIGGNRDNINTFSASFRLETLNNKLVIKDLI
jgi:hypothetical protein